MPAYLIVDVDVKDAARYEQYKRAAPRLIEKHGGRYIVRGGDFEVVEGQWRPTRLVLLEFPDRGAIREFLDDPEYEPLRELRHQAASSNLVAVEGL
jgi:uncharacterized protein (DUF1330 family)